MDSNPLPPGYSATEALPLEPDAFLLNLTPIAETSSFLVGYLGHGPASLQGEVQLKWTGSQPATTGPAVSRVEISFRGVERSGDAAIELVSQTQALWGPGAAGSSATASTHNDSVPPSSLPFRVDLTPDLPHCLHLATSSLSFTLTATLYYLDSSLAPLSQSAPVHLHRTSPPGSLLSGSAIAASVDPPPSTAPQTILVSEPVPLSVRLARTVFQRSEPIELLVRMEVPSVKVVQEGGLRLRTVSAELVRKITVGDVDAGVKGEVEEEAEPTKGNGKEVETVKGSHEEIEEVDPPVNATPPQLTVLARSGKSARFSPTRPIVIRLLLHPPAEPSCESVTQSTILHNVTFEVKVTVGLFSNHLQNDVVVARIVFIVPDSPPSSTRTDKQREVESDAETAPGWMPAEGPVPMYHEYAQTGGDVPPSPSPGFESTSAGGWLGVGGSSSVWDSGPGPDESEEYDGYEELSPTVFVGAPPTIDEDVSPPSASSSSYLSPPPPPPLLDTSSTPPPAPLTPPPDDFAHDFPSTSPHSSHSSTPYQSVPGSPVLSARPPLAYLEHNASNEVDDDEPPPPMSPTGELLPPPYAGGGPPLSTSHVTTVTEQEQGSEEQESLRGADEAQSSTEGDEHVERPPLLSSTSSSSGNNTRGPPPYTSHQELVGLMRGGELVGVVQRDSGR